MISSNHSTCRELRSMYSDSIDHCFFHPIGDKDPALRQLAKKLRSRTRNKTTQNSGVPSHRRGLAQGIGCQNLHGILGISLPGPTERHQRHQR